MLTLLFALTACEKATDTSGDDTGPVVAVCDRIHDATGVLRFDVEGEEITVHTPNAAPSDTTRTTGVAGPYGDGHRYASVQGGQVMIAEDDGCNWVDSGNLPSDGDWRLLAAGDRLYAFDRGQGRGATSDDDGASWSAFTLAAPFLAVAVDPADVQHAFGVTATAQFETTDGGAGWTNVADLPFTATAAAIGHDNADGRVIAGGTNVAVSSDGGGGWTAVEANLDEVALARHVAIDATDPTIVYVQGGTDDGVSIERTVDGGATFDRVASSAQVDLTADSPIWTIPGTSAEALSAAANPDGGVSLFRIQPGVGIRTTSVGTYLGVTDVAPTADRWIVSVHAVP